MSFIKLLWLHFSYCFNKRNIIILSISFLVIQALTIFTFLSYQNINMTDFDKMELIWNNIISLNRIIIGIICIFILGNFCLMENDEYALLLINKTNKYKFYISKFVLMIVVVVIYLLLILLSFIFIGFILNKEFILQKEYVLSYLYLLIIVIIYGNLSQIIVKLTNNIFGIIIVIIIFVSSSMWVNNDLLSFIFPVIDTSTFNMMTTLKNIFYWIFLQLLNLFIFTEFKK